ncbi:ABC transporter ATP-binding protein uup [Caulifigura coniformis]|uniref:ATP-binding protein Uup n=1 Tax=Caulifigura coniformis TaxID=2527983 RepID=A0A517SF37_9PLAN|nr:ATP-binding cassette domain-containing protein [Caulifigura coniformis]QDT54746.1 ABC transporter ATP-binding protein uup [Caulifigura coniformis]
MAWIQVRDVSFTYGGGNLLENVSVTIEPGERIGLVGRNGAGKSTLMKLLHGDLRPDTGSIDVAPKLKIARLAQEVPAGEDHTVFDEVIAGFSDEDALVARVQALAMKADAGDHHAAEELAQVGQGVDLSHGWELVHAAESVIDRMGLDQNRKFDELSSGMKRRVLLARALVIQPDVLLLDEPTNHLDIDSIRWLEEFLLREGITLIFVTHDRAFLQRLANRIIEVDRARLFDWTCDYKTFLVRKEAALEAEQQQQALFDKKLAAEEVWVRTGIKARRTRNEGRVRALKAMREERAKRRDTVGNVKLTMQDAQRSGALVAVAQNVSQAFENKSVLRDLNLIIERGDKIGIIGPNGAGKTTLIRTLLGEITPQSGTVRLGTNLQIAYFDQLRAQLDENRSAAENVGDGKDTVVINGKSRHIVGYLQDFLFSPDRSRSLVKYLSGGERNRLLLAKMFTQPSNLLILDEPTNDLDAETLELLESMLVEYPGTVLLVSHDREFLNNVVTSTLVFEGEGYVKAFAGGYDDWQRQKAASTSTAVQEPPKAGNSLPAEKPKQRKLTYKEQRELEALPETIAKLEADQAAIHAMMAEPTFYQQSGGEIAKETARLEKVTAELESAFERWTDLESVAGG